MCLEDNIRYGQKKSKGLEGGRGQNRERNNLQGQRNGEFNTCIITVGLEKSP